MSICMQRCQAACYNMHLWFMLPVRTCSDLGVSFAEHAVTSACMLCSLGMYRIMIGHSCTYVSLNTKAGHVAFCCTSWICVASVLHVIKFAHAKSSAEQQHCVINGPKFMLAAFSQSDKACAYTRSICCCCRSSGEQ